MSSSYECLFVLYLYTLSLSWTRCTFIHVKLTKNDNGTLILAYIKKSLYLILLLMIYNSINKLFANKKALLIFEYEFEGYKVVESCKNELGSSID